MNNNDRDLKAKNERGLITNFQDYTVHDGYGIRLLVFFKGCPLRCKWCQNPENINPFIEIEYHPMLCKDFARCLEVCPVEGAITKDKDGRIDREKCTRCMLCCEACPTKALTSVGEWMTVDEVVGRITRYRPFFESSGQGGVTLSGGEPSFQPDFSIKLLKECRKSGIHTAIETCGFTDQEIFREIIENCDLILFDIKHMNEQSHREGTGQSNRLILENFGRLMNETDIECVVRIPLIPGFNDNEENMRETAEFLTSLKRVASVDLLPFNELAESKYRSMGMKHDYAFAKRQSDKTIKSLKEILQLYGLEVTAEGLW